MSTLETSPSALTIVVAHQVPGRTRLRVSGVPVAAPVAERLAEALAGSPGVERVEIDRRTGGILCTHDAAIAAERLLERAKDALAAAGDTGPPAVASDGASVSHAATGVARELARLFGDIDRDLRLATEGKLDLGTATTLTFLAAGAVEVLVTQKIPAPPWFNLAWWGFRTFRMTMDSADHSKNKSPNEEKKP